MRVNQATCIWLAVSINNSELLRRLRSRRFHFDLVYFENLERRIKCNLIFLYFCTMRRSKFRRGRRRNETCLHVQCTSTPDLLWCLGYLLGSDKGEYCSLLYFLEYILFFLFITLLILLVWTFPPITTPVDLYLYIIPIV